MFGLNKTVSERNQTKMNLGADVEAQWATLWERIGALAPLLLIQLRASMHGKAAEDGPSAWAHEPMLETQMEFQPSFGLYQPLCSHLGREPEIKDSLSLPTFPFLSPSLSTILLLK